MLSPQERALRARIAAHTRWSKTADRTTAMTAAWAGLDARFAKQVDPDGTLDPETRGKLAESAKRAFYASLALKSAQARRTRSLKAKKLAAEEKAAQLGTESGSEDAQ